jgi:hypothetical protein
MPLLTTGSSVHRAAKLVSLQFEAAIKQLRTNRHPLVLTNLVGRLEIFPAPYLKDSEMSQLQIQSLPIADGFSV